LYSSAAGDGSEMKAAVKRASASSGTGMGINNAADKTLLSVNKQVKKGPFVFTVDGEDFTKMAKGKDVKLFVKLEFMKHYNEPSLILPVPMGELTEASSQLLSSGYRNVSGLTGKDVSETLDTGVRNRYEIELDFHRKGLDFQWSARELSFAEIQDIQRSHVRGAAFIPNVLQKKGNVGHESPESSHASHHEEGEHSNGEHSTKSSGTVASESDFTFAAPKKNGSTGSKKPLPFTQGNNGFAKNGVDEEDFDSAFASMRNLTGGYAAAGGALTGGTVAGMGGMNGLMAALGQSKNRYSGDIEF